MGSIYIDCTNGVSGDMLVGALLDLGADFEELYRQLESLNVTGFHVEKRKVTHNNKQATDYDVIIDERLNLPNVNLAGVIRIIDAAPLAPRVKERAAKIFTIAAEAGAKAHKVAVEEFFFHEKGAVDSFADIVGAAIGLDLLNIDQVFVSQIHDGSGFITYSKGRLPVPVPAVRNIVAAHQLDLISTEIEGELVTPTGAAVIAGIQSKQEPPQNYKIIRTGVGHGKRKYNPNALLQIHLIN